MLYCIILLYCVLLCSILFCSVRFRSIASSNPACWIMLARIVLAASSLVACASIELAMPPGVAVAMIRIGCLLNQVVT